MKIGKIVNKNTKLIVETVAYEPTTMEIYLYELKPDEILVPSEPPNDILKPKWQNDTWVEGATSAEIVEDKLQKEKEQKELEEKQKSEISKAEIMLGMTSMYEEFLQKDAENKLALAELYEMNLN